MNPRQFSAIRMLLACFCLTAMLASSIGCGGGAAQASSPDLSARAKGTASAWTAYASLGEAVVPAPVPADPDDEGDSDNGGSSTYLRPSASITPLPVDSLALASADQNCVGGSCRVAGPGRTVAKKAAKAVQAVVQGRSRGGGGPLRRLGARLFCRGCR